MNLVDFILNMAGLLLWLSWCSARLDPLSALTPATLAGTLRPAEPRRRRRDWWLPGSIATLILVRALIYYMIGPALTWTPKLNLTFISLVFHSEKFSTSLLYSFVSFASLLMVFYFWLMVLQIINRKGGENDPVQKLTRQHLSFFGRWHWGWQLFSSLMVVCALWAAMLPLFVVLRVSAFPRFWEYFLYQGGLLWLQLWFRLEPLLLAVLLLHFVASYVYLGNSAVWDFVALTSRNLLAPLRRVPLRLGKLDLAPLAGSVLVLLLLEGLPWMIHRWHLLYWPQ